MLSFVETGGDFTADARGALWRGAEAWRPLCGGSGFWAAVSAWLTWRREAGRGRAV